MNSDLSSSARRAVVRALGNGALRLHIQLTPEQLSAFETYVTTLLFWRARLSLTGASTAADVVRSHILDSLAVVQHIAIGSKLMDLGSGAGFPGVPLAIVCPHASITLVESRRKRANFLREVVRRCGLANASVTEGRVEDLPPQVAGAFDLVVSRALWSVPDFLRIASRFLRSGGLLIAMKGPRGLDEAISAPGFWAPETITYNLEGGSPRMLVVYRKH